MRRNRISHGVGGGNRASSGPLFTDHLKDINLELNLLKRKREMLEQQQQQQFIQPVIPQNNFNQLPYYVLDQNPAPSNHDFSPLYNMRSEQYNDGYEPYHEPFSRKHQSDNDWPHNSYPKKPAGQRQLSSGSAGPSSSRNQRPNTSRNQQANSIPLKHKQAKQFINQKINNQKQKRPIKELVTNKVKKPSKASVLPKKIVSQPVANCIKLAAAATTQVKAKKNEGEVLRLLPDKEPTNQVTGRLELALGTILREIRDTFGSRSHYQLLRLQRIAKQTIRERIRNVMLGKIVGSTAEIIKEYRAEYPQDTDVELANMALETENMKIDNESRFIEKDGPEDYFKTNIIKIVERHLNETFDRLENVYNPSASTGEERKCSIEETAEVNNEENEKPVEMEQESEMVTENIVANSEEQVPANTENVDSVKEESIRAPNTNNESANIEGDDVFNEYNKMLPRFLKRNIPSIIRLLNMSKGYRKDLDEIVSYTKTKLIERAASEHTSSTVDTSDAPQTPKKTQGYAVLPYYVKIMGKPKLPNRLEMNAFLQEFNPKSIKKHRTIHNLLFIGFAEKNGFDAVAKADGTVIGNSTLSIRVCDKNTSITDSVFTLNDNTDENVSQSQDVLNKSATNSDIGGNELDKQIVELLATVRKSAETPVEDSSKRDAPEEDYTVDADGENPHDDKMDDDKDEVLEKNEPVEDNEQNENAPNIDNTDEVNEGNEVNDQLAELKSTGEKATSTRASTRLANTPATPSSITTRRASRLIQN